jgi:hypothetical protein
MSNSLAALVRTALQSAFKYAADIENIKAKVAELGIDRAAYRAAIVPVVEEQYGVKAVETNRGTWSFARGSAAEQAHKRLVADVFGRVEGSAKAEPIKMTPAMREAAKALAGFDAREVAAIVKMAKELRA